MAFESCRLCSMNDFRSNCDYPNETLSLKLPLPEAAAVHKNRAHYHAADAVAAAAVVHRR